MPHILVVYEIRDQKIKKISFETTTAAKQLADDLGGNVSTLLIGQNLNGISKEPGNFGANKVYVIDKPELETFSPDVYARLAATAAREVEATHVLMGASAMGKDLLPRVAFHLNSGMAQDIIAMEVEDGKVQYKRPVLAGKLLSKVLIESEFQLASIRPNVFPATENATEPEVIELSPEIPEPRAVVEEVLMETGDKLDVTEASIIVSGGRGMKGPENWNLIEDLADAFGAAMGASRAVVDAGWRDHAEQVGQTGKTVSPNLYVACGISGAIQHQAGMGTSKYIVAINKDPEAPIFKIADYGIVGDVFEILPKLSEEVKKVRSEE